MEKIGIDVHKVATQVCVLTEDGEYQELRMRTERESLTAFFGQRAKARVLLEAATERTEQWALRIAARRGKRIAAVAVARKLAGILYAMTKHERAFDPERLRHAAGMTQAA